MMALGKELVCCSWYRHCYWYRGSSMLEMPPAKKLALVEMVDANGELSSLLLHYLQQWHYPLEEPLKKIQGWN